MVNSKVSFVYDGKHNESVIIFILNSHLTNVETLIEKVGDFIFRIYVYADEDEDKIFNVCEKITDRVVYDYNRKF